MPQINVTSLLVFVSDKFAIQRTLSDLTPKAVQITETYSGF